jgi:hypothetical protein
MDTAYAKLDIPFELALAIVATVIHANRKWSVADCGLKALGMDHGNPSLPDGKDRVPIAASIPSDASADFHVYGFEWTPTEVRYLVDGAVTQSLSAEIAADLNRPKCIVMSAYPSTRWTPSRSFDPSVLPSEAWFDWIEVYRFTGSCPTGVDGGDDAGDAE